MTVCFECLLYFAVKHLFLTPFAIKQPSVGLNRPAFDFLQADGLIQKRRIEDMNVGK
jgi:hypothetical protein